MRTCTHTTRIKHSHINIPPHTHAHTHPHPHTHTCTHTCIHIHTSSLAHTCTHMHTHTCMHTPIDFSWQQDSKGLSPLSAMRPCVCQKTPFGDTLRQNTDAAVLRGVRVRLGLYKLGAERDFRATPVPPGPRSWGDGYEDVAPDPQPPRHQGRERRPSPGRRRQPPPGHPLSQSSPLHCAPLWPGSDPLCLPSPWGIWRSPLLCKIDRSLL